MLQAVRQDGREPDARAALDGILAGDLRPVFQPIVDLEHGTVVGYEALARGLPGSPLELPAAMFGAARQLDRLAELDQACARAAYRQAEIAGLRAPLSLFVNVEPEVIGAQLVQASRRLAPAGDRHFPVFVEVTERSLTARPAELLGAVNGLREQGVGIALDDVGVDRRSLALLPLLAPDVVKLDISLLHGHPQRRSGEILNGVCAYAEHTGAPVLAEGIESADDLMSARAMGARLAQGTYFGAPGVLPPATTPGPDDVVALSLSSWRRPASVEAVLDAHRDRLRTGTKKVLLSITRALENQGLDLGEHAVVVAAFQDEEFFTEETERRYEQLARTASLTVGLGAGFHVRPWSSLRVVPLAPADPMCDIWAIAVIGPHFAAALLARDLGDDGPDLERRFEFMLSFDRGLVADIATALISRLAPPA